MVYYQNFYGIELSTYKALDRFYMFFITIMALFGELYLNHNNNLNKSVCVYVCGKFPSGLIKKNGKSYGTGCFGIVPTKL